jgi:hypothetical protein
MRGPMEGSKGSVWIYGIDGDNEATLYNSESVSVRLVITNREGTERYEQFLAAHDWTGAPPGSRILSVRPAE